MVLQNNKELIGIIQRVGCYYLSLARIVELTTTIDIPVEDLNSTWKLSKEKKYISGDNRIINPDGILGLLSGGIAKIVQVGEEKDRRVVYWNWVSDGYKKADYLIQMRLTKGAVGTHFVLCDKDKNCIFDSYSFKKYEWEDSGRYLHYKVIC